MTHTVRTTAPLVAPASRNATFEEKGVQVQASPAAIMQHSRWPYYYEYE